MSLGENGLKSTATLIERVIDNLSELALSPPISTQILKPRQFNLHSADK